MKEIGHQTTGVASAIWAALLFGISTPLAKLALASADSVLVAGLLYAGSGLGLAFLRLAKRQTAIQSNETPLSRRDFPWLAGAITAGGILAPVLLLLGLSRTSASSASLLLNLEAVATAGIAWIVFRENVDRRVGLGFGFILLGAILLSLPPSRGEYAISSGAALIASACLLWGIDNNLTRKISGSDPFQIAMWKGLTAGVVNTSLALGLGAQMPGSMVVAGVLLIGFLGYGFSLVLFVRALRDLGAARTGAYFSTAPFAGAAVAFMLGQGRADWLFASAGVLMLLGIWLHVTERHEHLHTHESMEYEHLHFHDEHHQHAHSPADPPGEPHAHLHRHEPLTHCHPHFPDLHHRHSHGK